MATPLLLALLASSVVGTPVNAPPPYGIPPPSRNHHDPARNARIPLHIGTTFSPNGTTHFHNGTHLDHHGAAPFPNKTITHDNEPGHRDAGGRGIIRPYTTAITSHLPLNQLKPVLTGARFLSSFATSVASICSTSVDPPAPTQQGIVPHCSKWHIAQPGDLCYEIADNFGISTSTFEAWNPAIVRPGSTQLLAGNAYCVQVCQDASLSSTSASFTPPPSSGISSLVPSSAPISVSASSIPLSSSAIPSAVPGSVATAQDTYQAYCGDGSVADGWPSMAQWASFDDLFEQNQPNMKISCENNWLVPNDSDEEIANLKSSIFQVEDLSGIDARVILAVIMQESTGCVRVITTAYSHANPGLMQSYDGTGTCNTNQAALGIAGTSASNVLTPCPKSEIYQMVLDGTNGTAAGPGLRQNFAQQGLPGSEGYYRTAKVYNGGLDTLLANENSLESGCCTTSYVSDIANRLTGWVNAARDFTC